MTDEQAIEQLRAKGYEISAVPTTFTNDHNDHHTKLEKRIDDLEDRTSLLSPNFFMRAFSVLGLYLFAIAIVGIGVALVIVVIGAAGG